MEEPQWAFWWYQWKQLHRLDSTHLWKAWGSSDLSLIEEILIEWLKTKTRLRNKDRWELDNNQREERKDERKKEFIPLMNGQGISRWGLWEREKEAVKKEAAHWKRKKEPGTNEGGRAFSIKHRRRKESEIEREESNKQHVRLRDVKMKTEVDRWQQKRSLSVLMFGREREWLTRALQGYCSGPYITHSTKVELRIEVDQQEAVWAE